MKILIGIVGRNGSGKEEFAKYLVSKYGFIHRDIGQEIRNEIKALGRNYLDRGEMDLMGNGRRKLFGPNYWCKLILDSVHSSDRVAISSIRNVAEVDELVSRGGVLVEVFADARTRYDRTLERVKSDPQAHGDVQSFEYFQEREKGQFNTDGDPSKMQLLECIAMATYRINNNGSIAALHDQADKLIESLKSPQD